MCLALLSLCSHCCCGWASPSCYASAAIFQVLGHLHYRVWTRKENVTTFSKQHLCLKQVKITDHVQAVASQSRGPWLPRRTLRSCLRYLFWKFCGSSIKIIQVVSIFHADPSIHKNSKKSKSNVWCSSPFILSFIFTVKTRAWLSNFSSKSEQESFICRWRCSEEFPWNEFSFK